MIIVVYFFIAVDDNKKIENECRITCEQYNMSYEGILHHLCACNPHFMTRVYLEPLKT